MKKYCVYVVMDGIHTELSRHIKIGVTSSLMSRLKQIQCGNPKRIFIDRVYNMKNKHEAFRVEKKMHKIFKKQRLKGEWFKNNTSVDNEIDRIWDITGSNDSHLLPDNFIPLMSHNSSLKKAMLEGVYFNEMV